MHQVTAKPRCDTAIGEFLFPWNSTIPQLSFFVFGHGERVRLGKKKSIPNFQKISPNGVNFIPNYLSLGVRKLVPEFGNFGHSW